MTLFTTKTLQKTLTPQEILAGNFGLEKEGLRITKEGKLATTPHPQIFGKKLENPYITTDFSESQVEIVTPTYDTIDKAYYNISFLVDIVNTNIPDDEYIWNNSLPCILPPPEEIPIAKYDKTNKAGKQAEEYRKQLSKKYGTKKQLISGIHYNFSFKEETIEKLYKNTTHNYTYREFKDQLYLKITRNYLRYRWLIIYLTGCSVGAHKTFTKQCLSLLEKEDGNDGYYSTKGPSFRNGTSGYKNIEHLYPRYDTVKNFLDDVNRFIDNGKLSEAKELYTQIRLKPKDKNNMIQSLRDDGILYIEIRTVDINSFDKCGISKKDMQFLHLFIIYLLIKEETEYDKWQEEGVYNEEKIAEQGYNPHTVLLKNGQETNLKEWGQEIVNEMKEMNKELNLQKEELINMAEVKINDFSKTHGKELVNIIQNKGFINSQISIAKNNKETSIDMIDEEYIRNNENLKETYVKALPGRFKYISSQ